jgi:hypothetical protein
MTQQLEEKMKKIINGKLYDSDKAQKICTVRSPSLFGFDVTCDLYRTNNNNWFITSSAGQLLKVSLDEVKKKLASQNVEKYIELFGSVDEA